MFGLDLLKGSKSSSSSGNTWLPCFLLHFSDAFFFFCSDENVTLGASSPSRRLPLFPLDFLVVVDGRAESRGCHSFILPGEKQELRKAFTKMIFFYLNGFSGVYLFF